MELRFIFNYFFKSWRGITLSATYDFNWATTTRNILQEIDCLICWCLPLGTSNLDFLCSTQKLLGVTLSVGQFSDFFFLYHVADLWNFYCPGSWGNLKPNSKTQISHGSSVSEVPNILQEERRKDFLKDKRKTLLSRARLKSWVSDIWHDGERVSDTLKKENSSGGVKMEELLNISTPESNWTWKTTMF